MATNLIEEYLVQLRRSLQGRPEADDICAEAEDHLREASARLELKGVDRAEAQRRTLAAFGDAGLVAKSFRSASGDAALASRTTRLGGAAALVAAGAWVVSMLLGIPEVLYDAPMWWYPAWSGAVTVAALATCVAVLGMLARGGRQRTVGAFIATACCVVAVLGLALVTWGWAMVTLFLAAAMLIGCLALRSVGLVDPWRDALLVAAWPVALAVLIVGDEMLGLGRTDTYGDHPLAFALAYGIGGAMFAAGLLRLGRGLRSEPAAALNPMPSVMIARGE